MNFNIDDVIKFKNGEYLVLDVIINKENTYLYLINNDEFLNDVSITKVLKKDQKYEFTNINSDEEFDYVMSKIFLNYKEDILNLLPDE